MSSVPGSFGLVNEPKQKPKIPIQTYEIVALPYGQSSEIIRARDIDSFRRRMAWYEGTRAKFEVWKINPQGNRQYLGTIWATNYSGTMYWNNRRFSLKTGRLL